MPLPRRSIAVPSARVAANPLDVDLMLLELQLGGALSELPEPSGLGASPSVDVSTTEDVSPPLLLSQDSLLLSRLLRKLVATPKPAPIDVALAEELAHPERWLQALARWKPPLSVF